MRISLFRIVGLLISLIVASPITHAVVKCPTAGAPSDEFALCATALCWALDGVSYCKCDIKNGQESISLPFSFTEGSTLKNVCDLLTQGTTNGFTISTYATPPQALQGYNQATERDGPPMALYNCDKMGYKQKPAYSAQCDGGVCFKSTTNSDFPGLGHIGPDKIVCSCPPSANKKPFQIAGPWNCRPGEENTNNQCCDKDFYNTYCGIRSIKRTGTMMAVGSPMGSAVALSILLDGVPPSINTCSF